MDLLWQRHIDWWPFSTWAKIDERQARRQRMEALLLQFQAAKQATGTSAGSKLHGHGDPMVLKYGMCFSRSTVF